jgi:hypothetical protein
MNRLSLSLIALAFVLMCTPVLFAEESPGEDHWIQLFNGKDLEGWTVKITGHDLKENYRDTFRVEDGILKVSYDQYPKFEGEFGHLFYKKKFSNYRLRVEYRFVGEQTPGGPDWALRNSGVMVHSQSAESMGQDQEFPISIEVQFLGGNGKDERHTGNLCTPGTYVVIDGNLMTEHCVDSSSKTYHGEDWVTLEVEVRGNSTLTTFVDGEVVLQYETPQLEEGAQVFLGRTEKMLHDGFIALQAESHPVEFRKVEILPLGESR